MDDIWTSFRLFLLLGVANTAPLVAKRLFGPRWSAPLDGGLIFFDGRPLFGSSKTIRGLVAMNVQFRLIKRSNRFPCRVPESEDTLPFHTSKKHSSHLVSA